MCGLGVGKPARDSAGPWGFYTLRLREQGGLWGGCLAAVLALGGRGSQLRLCLLRESGKNILLFPSH